MRHAVIGAGFGARVHLPVFIGLQGVSVVALADSGSGRAADAVSSGVKAFSDWRRMLDEMRPDSLSVAVPPPAQREIVSLALERGIHVLCEKPLGLSADESLALVKQAHASSVVAAVSFQFRFESGMDSLHKLCASGCLGHIRRIDFSWMTSGRADLNRSWGWQHDCVSGGGVGTAFFTHAADILYWLTKQEVSAVASHTSILVPQRPNAEGTQINVTAEDTVDVLCLMNDDTIVSFRITNCQYGADGMRIEIHGDEGIIYYHHRPPFLGSAEVILSDAQGSHKLSLDNASTSERDSRLVPMRTLAKLFTTAINGGPAEGLPSFGDALRSQRLLRAVHEAARNKQWVRLL